MQSLDLSPTLLSTITVRGQTVVPASIRRTFGLDPSHKLQWVVDKYGIRIVPVKPDPIAAFRGSGKRLNSKVFTVSDFLAERQIEREAERERTFKQEGVA